ncbi:MAG: extracellular solute-binding protein [Patescibacteria group bacterium]
MNTPLPKPSEPTSNQSTSNSGGSVGSPTPNNNQPVFPDPAKIGRSVAPTGVPKMEGVNPNLAPKTEEPSEKVTSNQPPAKSETGGPMVTPPPKLGVDKPIQPSAPVKPLVVPPGGIKPPTQTNQPVVGANQPKIAVAKSDPKKMILIIAAVLIGLGVIGSLLANVFGSRKTTSVGTGNTQNNQVNQEVVPPEKQTVLTYWGLWEPNAVLDEVIQEYQKQNPAIKIDYRIQSHKDYRERLQTAIASGNGPDIFRYHASWVRMLSSELAVLPASVMSAAEFKETFYPTAAQMLQIEGKIVGLPIMYEGLGLYYNKDILQTAGVQPPTTWAELKKLAAELSVPADKNARKSGGITRGGLAIGNTENVDHFADILALLILQNGGTPGEPAFTEVRDALVFYSNFVTEDAIWNSSLPSSTVAFAKGDAAMMFAPTWRAHEVKDLNPNLNFGIAPVPQLSDEPIAWANYWAEGVNDKSSNKEEAWKFLKYMTSAEVMKKLYSAQSNIRTFGEPYSRVDLASELASDPYVAGVLKDAPVAVGWYMSSATHDNGMNDQIIEYYKTAINQLVAGEDEEEVLLNLEKGVKQVLRQYGIE